MSSCTTSELAAAIDEYNKATQARNDFHGGGLAVQLQDFGVPLNLTVLDAQLQATINYRLRQFEAALRRAGG